MCTMFFFENSSGRTMCTMIPLERYIVQALCATTLCRTMPHNASHFREHSKTKQVSERSLEGPVAREACQTSPPHNARTTAAQCPNNSRTMIPLERYIVHSFSGSLSLWLSGSLIFGVGGWGRCGEEAPHNVHNTPHNDVSYHRLGTACPS